MSGGSVLSQAEPFQTPTRLPHRPLKPETVQRREGKPAVTEPVWAESSFYFFLKIFNAFIINF